MISVFVSQMEHVWTYVTVYGFIKQPSLACLNRLPSKKAEFAQVVDMGNMPQVAPLELITSTQDNGLSLLS